MVRILKIFLGSCLFLCLGLAQRCLAAPAWSLIWSDEFNGPAGTLPSASNWTYDLGGGGWGNNEWEVYTSSTANVSQDGLGHLAITATLPGALSSQNVYSARIKTQGLFSFQYGKIEASIQLPPGQGIWPAFWMLGANIPGTGWPNCGEIDEMEYVGSAPNTIYGTLHGPDLGDANNDYNNGAGVQGNSNLGAPVAGSFHTYDVVWSPGVVSFYVDGTLYATQTPATVAASSGANSSWVFDHPFFIILNLAIGGIWPGNPTSSAEFPAVMLVDYVRVYQDMNTPTPTPVITPSAPYVGAPLPIPGTIQAEDFDLGGQNVAYNSPSGTNTSDATRTAETVSIEACTDGGGGYDLSYVQENEWLNYTVDVQTAGVYNFAARVACNAPGSNGGLFHVDIDNQDVTGELEVPNTNGWQTWQNCPTLGLGGIALQAGIHVMTVVMDSAQGGNIGNFNYFSWNLVTAYTATPTPSFSHSPTSSASPSATLTSSPTPTASPSFTNVPPGSTWTDTPSDSPTLTASPSWSPTPTISTTFSLTPSVTVSPTATCSATAQPSATRTPSPMAQATQAGPIKVIGALPWPDPERGSTIGLYVQLSSGCDGLSLKLYSSALTLVWEGKAPGQAAGWNLASFEPPQLANGLYYYSLDVWRGGDHSTSKNGKLYILR